MSAADRQVEGNVLAPALPLIGEARNPLRGTADNPHKSRPDARWMMPLATSAIDRCMTRKGAAGILGISEATLSKKLNLQDGKCLDLEELAALGDRVAIAFHDELTCYFKLNDVVDQVKRAMALVTEGMSILVGQVTR